MQTQFKAGDTVRWSKRGICGLVTSSNSVHTLFREAGGITYDTWTSDLEIVKPAQPAHDFKVGDMVEIIGGKYEVGKRGEIIEVNHLYPCPYRISLPASILWCSADSLRSLLSPHSPQPQQNQTGGQDMKPYAVIFHNLTTGDEGLINATFTTEAGAKEHAEAMVAGQRASLTTKSYFTITILNTKTGELVGSVSDAPPAVDWAKK